MTNLCQAASPAQAAPIGRNRSGETTKVQRVAGAALAFIELNASVRLAAIFLLWAVPLLLTLACVTPPWQNPDEPLHFARAVQVAHGGLIGSRQWGTAGGVSDRAIYQAYAGVQHAAMQPGQRLTLQDLAKSGAVAWSPHVQYTSFPNTAQYPPVFYMPGAVAYWAGRAAGASINHTLLLARALNAMLFAAAAAAALGLARRTRLPLLAVTMLPTTLSLACAASQDSLMQAATLLAVALIDRVITAERTATRTESLVITALLVLVAMARPPYAGFLLALGLLAPQARRPLLHLALPAAAIVLAWCALVAIRVSVHLGGSDAPRQLALLAANPASIPTIIAGTLREFAIEWWVQLIAVLGWTDTRFPHLYVWFASGTLLLTYLAMPQLPSRRPWLPAIGIVFAVAAILVLQYLTWTWPGQPVVTGILGRYFTAPAMIAALCLPSLNLGRWLRIPALAALALLGAVTPAVILHTLVFRYYIN